MQIKCLSFAWLGHLVSYEDWSVDELVVEDLEETRITI